VKLKRTITLTKEPIRIQSNDKQIKKYNTINLNWMMKLKTNKTFTNYPRKKLKIQRMRTKLKNIIFDKLRFKNEIEKK